MDFFTPIVDDPGDSGADRGGQRAVRTWYAMARRPVIALNLTAQAGATIAAVSSSG